MGLSLAVLSVPVCSLHPAFFSFNSEFFSSRFELPDEEAELELLVDEADDCEDVEGGG